MIGKIVTKNIFSNFSPLKSLFNPSPVTLLQRVKCCPATERNYSLYTNHQSEFIKKVYIRIDWECVSMCLNVGEVWPVWRHHQWHHRRWDIWTLTRIMGTYSGRFQPTLNHQITAIMCFSIFCCGFLFLFFDKNSFDFFSLLIFTEIFKSIFFEACSFMTS